MQDFDHARAQAYEMEHTLRWVRENANWVWPRIDAASAGKRDIHNILLEEFFIGNHEEWEVFSKHLEGRAILDIGSGPVPMPALWQWAERRVVIDPLADSYDAAIRTMFGRSWWEGILRYATAAEVFHGDLSGQIDGAIICRNCLDHCAEPYLILSNIASYAAPGCALLLWSDLYHIDGHDHGHTDITRDKSGFKRLVENLGFKVLRETPYQEGRGTIQFGCFAVKQPQ
jgi:hypothetical protein